MSSPKREQNKGLDRAIAEILDGDISTATKATLLKQIEQPLPDVKEIQDAT